jgi:hypothetical protein
MGRKILMLNRIYFLNQGYTTRYTLMSNGYGRIRVALFSHLDPTIALQSRNPYPCKITV